MNEQGLNWFAWDGRTDLVLPDSLRTEWEGLSLERCTSDYARACNVDAPIAAITVGAGEALVISNAPLLTWVPSGKAGAFVVALAWADLTDDVALKLVERRHGEVDEEGGIAFKTSDTLLHVMAAGDNFGNEYGSGHFSIEVERGRYRIRTYEYDEGPEGYFLVHQLDWLGDV